MTAVQGRNASKPWVLTRGRPGDVVAGDKVTIEWSEDGQESVTTGIAYDKGGEVMVGGIKMRLLGKPTGLYARLRLVSVEREGGLLPGSVCDVEHEHEGVEGRRFAMRVRALLVRARDGSGMRWDLSCGCLSDGVNFANYEPLIEERSDGTSYCGPAATTRTIDADGYTVDPDGRCADPGCCS